MFPKPTIVYILRSDSQPNRYYTGLTSDLAQRLAAHNLGLSKHTASGRPWRVVVSIEFSDPSAAASFEKYLKSGSGRAIARRYLRESLPKPEAKRVFGVSVN
jgi:putative endonuclease